MSQKLVRIARLKQLAKDRSIEGPVLLGAAIGRKPNQTSDLLSGRASFGEKVARSIEEAADLPIGWLDGEASEVSRTAYDLRLKRDTEQRSNPATVNKLSTKGESEGASPTLVGAQSGADQPDLPKKVPFTAVNVATAVHMMSDLIWTFDNASRPAIGLWLKMLADDPDMASTIASKMAALATEQIDISNNAEINKAMRAGRGALIKPKKFPAKEKT